MLCYVTLLCVHVSHSHPHQYKLSVRRGLIAVIKDNDETKAMPEIESSSSGMQFTCYKSCWYIFSSRVPSCKFGEHIIKMRYNACSPAFVCF